MVNTFMLIGSALGNQGLRQGLLELLKSNEPRMESIEGVWVVVVPNRDLLLFCDDDRGGAKFAPAAVSLNETIKWLEGSGDGSDWQKTIRWLE